MLQFMGLRRARPGTTQPLNNNNIVIRDKEIMTSNSLSAQSLSHVQLLSTLWTVAPQAPLSLEFSRQEYWSRLPSPSPFHLFKGTSFDKLTFNLNFESLVYHQLKGHVPWLLEKEMPAHSSLLAWRIPQTEEPGGLQSMGSQRVRHV